MKHIVMRAKINWKLHRRANVIRAFAGAPAKSHVSVAP